jgi:plasmid stabilization system protein ParE
MPERCSLAAESPVLGHEIRHLIVGSYRVLFTVRGDAVYVLHVRHGARREWEPEQIVLPET